MAIVSGGVFNPPTSEPDSRFVFHETISRGGGNQCADLRATRELEETRSKTRSERDGNFSRVRSCTKFPSPDAPLGLLNVLPLA